VLKLKPDDATTHAARGTALALLEKFDDALKSLDKSLDLVPRSPFAYIQRARVHAVQENPKEAINDLDKALLIQPDNIQALLLRATMYQQEKKIDKALADVEAVLERQPGLVAALRIKALLLADANRLDEAIADLEKVRGAAEKGRDPELMVQLAILYGLNKQPQKAIEVYSDLIKDDPKLWIAWRGRGDLYLTHGEQAKAKDDFEEALRLQPKDSGILNNLAWLLSTSPDEKLRDAKRAIELATMACEVTSYKEAHILSTLAAGYAEAGEWDKAVEWSQKAYDLGEGDIKEQLAKELESYKEKKPWRELLLDGEPAEGSSNEKKKSEEPGKAN
jgi:tetratricopeptide (TPR) repeat protein